MTTSRGVVYFRGGDFEMTLDDIRKEIITDTQIDDAALDAESLRIPKLHGKYLNFLLDERLALAKHENDLSVMLPDKWEYYTGKMSQEELQSR